MEGLWGDGDVLVEDVGKKACVILLRLPLLCLHTFSLVNYCRTIWDFVFPHDFVLILHV